MKELFLKYLNAQCSPEEVKELLACFSAENESALRALINASLGDVNAENNNEESEGNSVPDKIYAIIKTQITSENGKVGSKEHNSRITKRKQAK